MSALEYSYRTEVKTARIIFEWTIENFSLLLEVRGEAICSPHFYSENKQEQWQIKFYPRGRMDSTEDYSSLSLTLLSGKLPVKMQCKFFIVKSGTVIETDTLVHTYNSLGGYGFPDYVARSRLFDGTSDIFTISCQIDKPLKNIYPSQSNPSIPMTRQLSVDTEAGRLTANFAELLGNSKFSDVTIIVDNEKLPAHKIILAARSPVFAAMFGNQMSENKTNEIKIEKMELSVVKGMLEFIYTDKISNFEEISNGLLPAADKYNLVRLRALCEESLAKTVSNETAVEIFVLADLHHSDNLKNYVMHFIDDHLADIIDSEGYKEMEENYPGLLKELLRFVALQKKSKKF